MGVLATSREIEAALYAYSAKPSNENFNRCLGFFAPYFLTLANKHPLWLQDDVIQQMRLCLKNCIETVLKAHKEGRVKKLVPYIIGILDRQAKGLVASSYKSRERFVKLDDATITRAILPDTSEDYRDLVTYLKGAAEEMIRARWGTGLQARRASRWVSLLLQGERPKLDSTNMARFNQSRYGAAKHMYSIILHRLRELVIAQLSERGKLASYSPEGSEGGLDEL